MNPQNKRSIEIRRAGESERSIEPFLRMIIRMMEEHQEEIFAGVEREKAAGGKL